MWTRFMDMHSGGGTKEKPHEFIYIEALEEEAKVIFYNRFGHNPERVTCTCCGEDYSISSEKTLRELTAYDRNCEYVYFSPNGKECKEEKAWIRGKGIKKGYYGGYVERQRKSNMDIRISCKTAQSDLWGLYITLAKYRKQKNVLIISSGQIKSSERKGNVPIQGYIWQD